MSETVQNLQVMWQR